MRVTQTRQLTVMLRLPFSLMEVRASFIRGNELPANVLALPVTYTAVTVLRQLTW